MVATDQTAALDATVLQIARSAPGQFSETLRTLTHVGDTVVVFTLAGVLGSALALAGHIRTSAAALGAVGATAIANSVLKQVVDRSRPDALQALVGEQGASYPSGHAALSAALCGVLAILVTRSTWPPMIRVSVVGGLAVLALLVGASRLYLGVHYASDVVGAWLLAIAAAATFAEVTARSAAPS